MAAPETQTRGGATSPAPRPSWWARLKARFSGSLQAEGTAAFPAPMVHAQHQHENRGPLPDTPETRIHNSAIEAEYQAEIARRRALWQQGQYTPRFYEPMYDPTSDTWIPDLSTPDWHLELSQEPGRRVDVTKDAGVVMQAQAPADVADDKALADLRTLVDRAEGRGLLGGTRKTGRDLVGTRAQILAACHGDVALANQAEAEACKQLGLTSLDDLLPTP